MKKFSLLIILFFLTISNVNAGISSSITFTGTTVMVEDLLNQGNGGKIFFPDSLTGVIINASALDNNLNDNIEISGNFWIENTSLTSTGIDESGWATFDIGTVVGAPKVVLSNNLDNTFTFNGYAWSKSAGWIYFGDTGITNGKVIYDRSTSKVNGCAWSQNLSWICIDNFNLDTIPPVLWADISEPFAANHNKTILVPITEQVNKIKIENWDSIAQTTYTGSTFTHDFRKAKLYYIEVIDFSGNSYTGSINVVASVPSLNLTDGGIGGGATASKFSPDITLLHDANGYDNLEIKINLRDTYGNVIKNEIGIKEVEIDLGFENNVDIDQIENLNSGDSITYSSVQFPSLTNASNEGLGYTPSGDYIVDLTSYTPTKAGYDLTTDDNDIKIEKLNINISALNGNTGVGEGNSNLFTSYIEKEFKFTPTVNITNITNSHNRNLLRDQETTFTGSIEIESPNDISNLKISHLFDVLNTGDQKNDYISFQAPLVDGLGVLGGYGYNKPNIDNTDSTYECSDIGCNYDFGDKSQNLSNVIAKYNNTFSLTTNFDDSFKITPRIVLPGLPFFDIYYNSVIEYNTDGITVKYPSYRYPISNLIVTKVKIIGIMNENKNNFSIVTPDETRKIGNIPKLDLLKNIKKNIAQYQKIGDSVGKVFYKKGDYTLSTWPAGGYDTIIIDGGDLIISGDITKIGNELKSIIVMKGENSNKGNIWIKSNVQRIEAILVTDKAVFSGNGSLPYNIGTAKKQLYIKGSIISYNTVGGSSAAIPKCPYYEDNCNLVTSQSYDFNNFRYFSGDAADVVPFLPNKTGYDTAPIIIEYDPLIQTKPPKILTNQ